MDDVASMTGVLAAFLTVFKKVSPYAAAGGSALAGVLLVWQMGSATAATALGSPMHAQLMKFVGALALSICVWNSGAIISGFANGMSGLGSKYSQGTLSGNIMKNPGKIMNIGFKGLDAQWQKATSTEGVVDTLKQIPVTLFLVLATLSYMATAVLAIKAVVNANVKIVVGSTMVPWLIAPLTRPIGMAGVGMIVGAVAELAIKSVLIGIGSGIIGKLNIPANADVHDLVLASGKCLAVAWICADVGGVNAAVAGLSGRR